MPKMQNYKKNNQLTRYYKKYQQLKMFPRIYPSPYDSCLIYYNQLVALTDAATGNGYFAGAYEVQNYVAHINLRQYFAQYRVEKVTMTVVNAEAPTMTSIWMATTHTPDGAAIGASTPNLNSIRSYKDVRNYQVNDTVAKCVWRMDPRDPQELLYRDVAAVTIDNADKWAVGGCQLFYNCIAGAGNIACQALVKYKVRYIGKQAIAL